MYDIFYLYDLKKENRQFPSIKERFPLIKVIKHDSNLYDAFTRAQRNSITKLFWIINLDTDYFINDNFDFDYDIPEWDWKYVHVWQTSKKEFNMVYFMSKTYNISKNEASYAFFINKKEISIEAVRYGYDILQLNFKDNFYDVITKFQKKARTTMFWVLAPECKLLSELNYVVPDYDKEYVHQWTASNSEYLHLNLIPSQYPISKREADNLFFVSKKEMSEKIFKENYDIIFISYNELNAEENWERLLERFPEAKRVHGIVGIHNAHKYAAQIARTSMFWVVDGDSQIVEDFNFEYVVDPWDKDSVFVWKSKNPINNLSYGNGGVKLLPKSLTMDLDNSTIDMTTSISKKFISVDKTSNLTIFNTDPFNAWKSAFRECVKLSSKIIDGQIDIESETRLNVWCTVGIDQPFGEYSIKGANAGKDFGTEYCNDTSMLSKINDWNWLIDKFKSISKK